MSFSQEGGCFCGNVRYAISEPAMLQLHCFCEDCRRRAGTDGYAGYMVANGAFTLTRGTPAVFEKPSSSGRTVKLNFCATCGSNLWGETELGMVSVAAGSLDDPGVFTPEKVAFLHQAPAWARIPDGLDEI